MARRSRRVLLCGLLAGCTFLPAGAPAPPRVAPLPAPVGGLLLRDGFVMTAAGSTLEHADVWIREDEVGAVGKDLARPPGARVVELDGRWVTPGLIDPHSHIGVYALPAVRAHRDGNEASRPLTPEMRAEEAFWPQDPVIQRALAGGVTAVHVLPGSANLVGGEGVTLRLAPRLSARAMRFPGAPRSMKMACGENPKRVHGEGKGSPQTRMAEVAMLRDALEGARVYRPAPGEKADHGKAALAAVLRGEVLVQMHCYRADEMLVRLDLLEGFGIRPRAFHHAVEAYKIRGRLAGAGVGAVVWADRWGEKMEMLDAVPANAALLDRAGVRVALHSDSPRDIQRLNQQAAVAMAAGRRAGLEVERDRALRWITANPAWVLGIDRRTGTLEPGKQADLVVWSGDPFSVYTRADLVFVAGKLEYDRAHPPGEPFSDFELGIRRAP